MLFGWRLAAGGWRTIFDAPPRQPFSGLAALERCPTPVTTAPYPLHVGQGFTALLISANGSR
jgi:hypothetical protein